MSGKGEANFLVFSFCSLLSNTILRVGRPFEVDIFGIITLGAEGVLPRG